MAKKKFNPEYDDFDMSKVLENDMDPVFIDTAAIEQQAKTDSIFLVRDLSKIYGNQKFMDEHPDYKKRLDIELESLRVLLKMRKSGEVAHDIIIQAIAQKPDNASLYKSMTAIQSSLLSIQKQMDETIKNLNNLLKNYQFELRFDDAEKELEKKSDDNETSVTFRGSKDFINSMNASTDSVSDFLKGVN